MNTNLLGRWGEQTAAEYLQKKRYRLLGMNYRTRFGELDLIAANKKYLVFVEVKLRRSDSFAAPREYVTAAKIERLKASAELWLQENETKLQPRFDVIEILAPEGEKTLRPKITHIENAF